MAKSSIKPFELLTEYERLSLKHKVIIEQIDVQNQWSGVGFQVGDVYYAIAIDRIVEVLILTEITKIPGISQWVLGLGNIRGNLIPIVDLKSFFVGHPTKTTAHTRMVVIQQIGGQVGLVVDEVFGQKHFTMQDTQNKSDNKDVIKYSQIAYQENDIEWNVLDYELLINDPIFQNAATI